MNLLTSGKLHRRRFLEKSWAKIFAGKIFPAINEDIFSVLYSSKASHPNTPVNVIVGALILKEALGDSDDELVLNLICSNQFVLNFQGTNKIRYLLMYFLTP